MTIDVDALREYLRDYLGTAMFNGMPMAVVDLADVDRMDDLELVHKAQELGIDLSRFAV